MIARKLSRRDRVISFQKAKKLKMRKGLSKEQFLIVEQQKEIEDLHHILEIRNQQVCEFRDKWNEANMLVRKHGLDIPYRRIKIDMGEYSYIDDK